MANIFEEGISMQPVLPKLKVLKLTDVQELHDLLALMKRAPNLFPGVDTVGAEVVENEIRPFNVFSFSIPPLARIGDYLVTSENGMRYITTRKSIKYGVLEGIPSELFAPVFAENL